MLGQNGESSVTERMPILLPDLAPPLVHGVAELTHLAFAGADIAQLLAAVERPARTLQDAAAVALDCSIVHRLAFQVQHAAAMQTEALALSQIYRVASHGNPDGPKLRLLAVMEPGDLMTNTPLDFITRALNVQLDLLYLLPDRALPEAIPEHDLAYFGGGDIDAPVALERRAALYRAWPRPVLNDPMAVSRLARAELARSLADMPGVCSPRCMRVTRDAMLKGSDVPLPMLIRPVGSHAGANLEKVETQVYLDQYLTVVDVPEYYVTAFEDYRSPDGWFRKYRVAFIGRAAFLCHMGVSENWMIHYLNAGMTGSEDKRQDEADAMATFDTGFARRHNDAFNHLIDEVGLDYFTLDCGETKDGRLLVFEADAEAIVHMMDPPDMFPYKLPQMERVFAAFDTMLHAHAGKGRQAAALAA